MPFEGCKPGDIVTYTLGSKDSYTSIIIHLDFDDDIYSVLDIATTNSTYTVPQAYVFRDDNFSSIIDLEIVGHVNLFASVKDQYPELFL